METTDDGLPDWACDVCPWFDACFDEGECGQPRMGDWLGDWMPGDEPAVEGDDDGKR